MTFTVHKIFSTQSVRTILYTVLSYVACLSLLHFSTLSHKRYNFREKFLNIKYVSISSTTFKQFLF
jgi:hypothetical protein